MSISDIDQIPNIRRLQLRIKWRFCVKSAIKLSYNWVIGDLEHYTKAVQVVTILSKLCEKYCVIFICTNSGTEWEITLALWTLAAKIELLHSPFVIDDLFRIFGNESANYDKYPETLRLVERDEDSTETEFDPD